MARRHAAILRASRESNPAPFAKTILDLGFQGLGLEEPLHAFQWDAIAEVLPRDTIASVAVFLPFPAELRRVESIPFSIASLHPEEKREALRQGIETIRFADRQRIPFVRIPPFALEGGLRGKLIEARRDRFHSRERMAPLLAKRRGEAGTRIDSLLSFLSKLLDAADRYGIRLAMTPGGFIDEAPSVEETLAILRELKGAPLCVWPDTLRSAAALDGSATSRMPEPLVEAAAGVTLLDFTSTGEPAKPGEGRLDAETCRDVREAASIWMVDPVAAGDASALERGRELIESLERGPPSEAASGFRLV